MTEHRDSDVDADLPRSDAPPGRRGKDGMGAEDDRVNDSLDALRKESQSRNPFVGPVEPGRESACIIALVDFAVATVIHTVPLGDSGAENLIEDLGGYCGEVWCRFVLFIASVSMSNPKRGFERRLTLCGGCSTEGIFKADSLGMVLSG
jgi:hypothetical protein